MNSIVFSTIAANLAATGCAIFLLRRRPTRRLKMLTLTVGLMSLAQTASIIHIQGPWAEVAARIAGLHQSLAGLLSLLAIYLLGREIYDRNQTDRKLRLVEYEAMRPSRRGYKNLPLLPSPDAQEPAPQQGLIPLPQLCLYLPARSVSPQIAPCDGPAAPPTLYSADWSAHRPGRLGFEGFAAGNPDAR